MPDLNITITVDGATAHVCGGMCDCPKAITRAQNAIDTDRAERGTQPRGLSERLRGMRHGAPGPEWFDAMAQRADVLETACGMRETARDVVADTSGARTEAATWAARCDADDAMTLRQRAAALHDAVEATVRDLERAELILIDHEYVHDANVGESLVWAGNLKFVAGMTGQLDTPATHYLIRTSRDDDDEPGTERTTNNLAEVRAWLLAWGAPAVYA